MLRIIAASSLNEVADKNFNILLSLSYSGFAVGMVLLPLFAAAFVGPYGWRGGMLLLGAFMGNVLPCTLAFSNQQEHTEKDQSSRRVTDTHEEITLQETTMEQNIGVDSSQDNRYRSECDESGSSDEARVPTETHQENVPLLTSPRGRGCSSLSDSLSQSTKRHRLMKSKHTVCPADNSKDGQCSSGTIAERAALLIRESDFNKDPICILVILSGCAHAFTYSGWHAFLIPHALQRGISLQHTIIITLCASVGNLLGRLLSGFLTHRWVEPINIYLILTLSNVGLLLCYAFIKHFAVMLFLSFLSAWAILGRAVIPILVIRQRSSPENFPTTLAFLDFFEGVGTLIGGFLSGINLRDEFSLSLLNVISKVLHIAPE